MDCGQLTVDCFSWADTPNLQRDRKIKMKRKTLLIQWQRLVDEKGKTCKRCQRTYEEIQKAYKKLKKALSFLSIDVIFEQKGIPQAKFAKDPSESNRIWISAKPLEDWLSAEVGQSPCCDTCGDVECRTVELDKKVYGYIPEYLIIKAGLIAASQIF